MSAKKVQKHATEHLTEIQKNASELAQGVLQPGENAEPVKRPLDFAEGPLGFEIEGARIVAVEAGGQAEGLGVQVGDRIVAVAGDVIPAPPATDSVADGEKRVKKLIGKRIKDKPRPVQITFLSAPAPPAGTPATPAAAAELDAQQVPAEVAAEASSTAAATPSPAEVPAEAADAAAAAPATASATDAAAVEDLSSAFEELESSESPAAAARGTEPSVALTLTESSDDAVATDSRIQTLEAALAAARREAEAAVARGRQEVEELKDKARVAVQRVKEDGDRRLEAAERAAAEARAETERVQENAQQQLENVKQRARDLMQKEKEERERVAAQLEQTQQELAARSKAEMESSTPPDGLEALEELRGKLSEAVAAKAAAQAELQDERQQREALAAQLQQAEAQPQAAATEASQPGEEERLAGELATAQQQQAQAQAQCEELMQEMRKMHEQLEELQAEVERLRPTLQATEEEKDGVQAEARALSEQFTQMSEDFERERSELRAKHDADRKRCEDLTAKVSTLQGDLQGLAEQLAEARNEVKEQQEACAKARADLQAQQEAHMQEAQAVQEKALGAVQRVREQGDKKADAAAAELREARAEAESLRASLQAELKKAQAKAEEADKEASTALAATSEQAASLESNLTRSRAELRASQERCRKAERELEQSQAECQELLKSHMQRDDRVGAAQSLLEGRLASLQEQLDCAKGEQELAKQKAQQLVEELKASKARCSELELTGAQGEEEQRLAAESSETQLRILEAEVQRLREASTAAEARSCSVSAEATQKLEAASAREAQALQEAKEKAREAEAATARAATAEEQAASRAAALDQLQMGELPRLREEAESCRADSDSRLQLIRALQKRLAEQEQQASLTVEDLRRELSEMRAAAEKSVSPASNKDRAASKSQNFLRDEDEDEEEEVFKADKKQADISAEASPESAGGGVTPDLLGSSVPEAESEIAPPEDAGREEVSALYERIGFLEKRCRTLQKKLDARPIVFQAQDVPSRVSADNPLGLESGIGLRARTSWLDPVAKRLNLPQGWEQRVGDLCNYVEQPLRAFTQRLLKRDAWLLVFYAHLLVLYTIAASCMYQTRSPYAASPSEALEAKMRAAAKGNGGG